MRHGNATSCSRRPALVVVSNFNLARSQHFGFVDRLQRERRNRYRPEIRLQQSQTIDEVRGFPHRLASKLLGAGSEAPRHATWADVRCAGLKLIAIENEETLERYRERRIKRDAPYVVSANARWSKW
jgi:hypothetical protein